MAAIDAELSASMGATTTLPVDDVAEVEVTA